MASQQKARTQKRSQERTAKPKTPAKSKSKQKAEPAKPVAGGETPEGAEGGDESERVDDRLLKARLRELRAEYDQADRTPMNSECRAEYHRKEVLEAIHSFERADSTANAVLTSAVNFDHIPVSVSLWIEQSLDCTRKVEAIERSGIPLPEFRHIVRWLNGLAMRLSMADKKSAIVTVKELEERGLDHTEHAKASARSTDMVSEKPTDLRSKATASPDFASVNWYGTKHVFGPAQAAVVSKLWEANEKGAPSLSKSTLLNAIPVDVQGSSTEEMSHLFRKHSAWKTMIVSPKRGVYRLADPPAETTILEESR